MIILEKAFHPRKARKSRNGLSRQSREQRLLANKSINYIMSVNHPSGDSLEKAMHLNLFVFFASFHLAVKCLLESFRVVRGQLIF
jgi:hypothetical protein